MTDIKLKDGIDLIQPTADQKAATKKYVDDNIGNSGVSDAVYSEEWNAVTTVSPSKNAIYDKIQSLTGTTGDITIIGTAVTW